MPRVTINRSGNDYQFSDAHGKRGKDGHIKIALWFERKIKFGEKIALNRGSLIEFINANRAPTEKKLKKGLFFGGAKEEEIRERLKAIMERKQAQELKNATHSSVDSIPIENPIILSEIPDIPAPIATQVTYEELLENSKKFQEKPGMKMQTEDNQINQMEELGEEIAAHANNTHPIITQKVWVLGHRFLEYKKVQGTEQEKNLYADMSLTEFFDRLITKRPLVFYNADDRYLLQDGTKGKGGFEDIGTDKEKAPLILQDYLSYDEMQISAYLSQSTPTHFINSGTRDNKGIKEVDPESFEQAGIYYGMVGARFEKKGLMEDEFVIIRKNCPRDPKKAAFWSEFFETDLPSYRKAEAGDPTRFAKVKEGYFDKSIYKAMMKPRIEAYLMDADGNAEAQNKLAYLHIVGLGLGVWAPNEIKVLAADIQREIYLEVIQENNLKNIGTLDFSWFPKEVKDIPSSIEVEDQSIEIVTSKRNPADKVPEGHLLCAMYAWDGNSFPGNEYWIGALNASGDPAAICCSTLGELQNPFINPNARGPNLHVY